MAKDQRQKANNFCAVQWPKPDMNKALAVELSKKSLGTNMPANSSLNNFPMGSSGNWVPSPWNTLRHAHGMECMCGQQPWTTWCDHRIRCLRILADRHMFLWSNSEMGWCRNVIQKLKSKLVRKLLHARKQTSKMIPNNKKVDYG